MTMHTICRLVSFIVLLPVLAGCYCFKPVPTESDLRTLRTSKPYSNCDGWGGDGHGIQANAYYGFPSTVKEEYINSYIDDNVDHYNFNSIGQFGIRIEKYLPSFFTNYAVFGVGLDYSEARFGLDYTLKNSANPNELDFIHRRLMLSLNHMVLVQGRFIGYITLQGGANFTSRSAVTDQPGFQFNNVYQPVNLAYRAGYGLQFYPFGPYGITVEGGFDGGAYVRAGFFCWIF